jgi:hypothetical protein
MIMHAALPLAGYICHKTVSCEFIGNSSVHVALTTNAVQSGGSLFEDRMIVSMASTYQRQPTLKFSPKVFIDS